MPKKGWSPQARVAAALARKRKSGVGNISRARSAQQRSNAKLGTKGTSGANSAIKGYRKANAFKKAASGVKPTGKAKKVSPYAVVSQGQAPTASPAPRSKLAQGGTHGPHATGPMAFSTSSAMRQSDFARASAQSTAALNKHVAAQGLTPAQRKAKRDAMAQKRYARAAASKKKKKGK